ncbi:hypothetical protein [Bremerella cremea]|uniref:hypothetical protein n=1 Tax=Bremerella cremea TaxID=1031537 RepID=UPI0011C07156|nr:hypothetical protein [Bremerella cremea]
MSTQYRTTTLFKLCFASALAATFYGNASILWFVMLQSLLGAYVGAGKAMQTKQSGLLLSRRWLSPGWLA